MFAGEYHHTVDDKNRLAIPSKILEKIDKDKEEKGFFITRGFDNCLVMYTPRIWRILVSRIAKLSFTDKKARQFQRRFFSKAQEIPDCDQQGRILIPQYLKELVRIEKKVVIVGIINRIEIWDETMWDAYESECDKEGFEGIEGDLFQLSDSPGETE